MTLAGLILAGGRSTRMGCDKALVALGDAPLVGHAIRRLGPQVGPLALNANGDADRFAGFGLPVVPDDLADTGPLGGILAGLVWAAALEKPPRSLVTVPVDGPFLPRDLVVRLTEAQANDETRIVIAASGDRDHPVFGLWPLSVATPLAQWRRTAKSQGVRGFLASQGFAVATWPLPAEGPDPFLNINSPGDLTEAEAWLAAGAGL